MEMLSQALRQMLRYKTSTALVILGVAMGVANIIMLISITDLSKRQTVGLIEDFGSNMLVITPFADAGEGVAQGMSLSLASTHMPSQATQLIAALPQIERAAGFQVMPAFAASGERSLYTTIVGVDPVWAELVSYKPAQGRWLSDADQQAQAQVTCLGGSVSRELFGGENPMGRQVAIKGRQFTVVGVMETKGRIGLEDFDNRCFIVLPLLQQLNGLDGLHAVFAHFKTSAGAEDSVAAVQQALGALVGPGETVADNYTVFTIDEARRLFNSTMGIFRAVLAGISSIAMLVAGLGIMNVMLIRVMQRRKEIGVRLASGATPRLIALQFLLESVLQATLGAALGIGLGAAGVHLYCHYAGWQPYLSPLTVVLAGLFSCAVGLLFGAYPALRASRTDPILSLRTEL
jgi:putative ABC transport system permease protein